jgi:nucleotide-binding universal stress UspA family protein
MERHLLLTVNASHSHQHASRFASYFLKGDTNTRLTLFYVAPNPHLQVDHTKDISAGITEADTLAATYKRKGKQALDQAKKLLIDNGFPEKMIETKLQLKNFGTVMDIIQEAEKGYYDAVLLGRRGLSMFEELVDDSISKNILREEIDFPLWICKEPEAGRKNVLLCADGSEESLRVADHVGFMLADTNQHDVTLFHVCGKDQQKIDISFDAARTALIAAGFPQEKIHEKVDRCGDVAQTILNHALTNNYAAIAMGTTGAGQKYLQSIFMGSVCMSIFKSLKKVSLFVSR